MMNWNLGNLVSSLKFFQSLNLQQIVAGYYDSGNGTQSANSEMANVKASGVGNNVIGWMYTTWQNDYSQLQSYAAAIKAQWPPLKQAAPDHQSLKYDMQRLAQEKAELRRKQRSHL